jgi:hypothetical protein
VLWLFPLSLKQEEIIMKTLKIQSLLSLVLFFMSGCGGVTIFVGGPTLFPNGGPQPAFAFTMLALMIGVAIGIIVSVIWFIVTRYHIKKLNDVLQRDQIEKIRIEKIRISLEEQKEEQRNLLENKRIAEIEKLENYGKHSKCPQCGAKNITLTDNVVCAYCGSSYHF